MGKLSTGCLGFLNPFTQKHREEKRHRHLRKTTITFKREAPAGFPETKAALRTEDAHSIDLDHVHAHQHWPDNVFSAESKVLYNDNQISNGTHN